MATLAITPHHLALSGTPSLETETARHLSLGPVLVVGCNSLDTITNLEQRDLWPILVESRSSVASSYRTRGYRVYEVSEATSLPSVQSILLGQGIFANTSESSLATVLTWCAHLAPLGVLAVGFSETPLYTLDQFLTGIVDSLGADYAIQIVAQRMADMIIVVRRTEQRTVTVRWEGSQNGKTEGSLAFVNNEFCSRLVGRDRRIVMSTSGQIEQVLPILETPDIVIRQGWPPSYERPQTCHFVHMQPWEFGSLPEPWLRGLQTVDEVWAYGEYCAQIYREAGYPNERIKIIPLGFDPASYYPLEQSALPPEEDVCIFTFVGGLILRKGADAAIEAFCKAFTANDNVVLIIKSSGTKSFYAKSAVDDMFQPFTTTPNAPRYKLVEEHLTVEDLAHLYRNSSALVASFRGEGFGLPALDAMACGTPVIYSQGGSMDDFIPEGRGYPIATKRGRVHRKAFDIGELIEDGWLLQPNIDSLVENYRSVYNNRAEAKRRGKLAAQHAHANFTWDHSAQAATTRIFEIAKMLGLSV